MKAVTIRLYEPYEALAKKLFEQPNPGCQEAVECFLDLRTIIIREIRGIFARNELIALIDLRNGIIFESRFAVQRDALIAEIEDKELYDGMGKRFNIDVKALIEKVKSMPTAQIFFILYEINRFWEMESDKEGSLDKFIMKYVR